MLHGCNGPAIPPAPSLFGNPFTAKPLWPRRPSQNSNRTPNFLALDLAPALAPISLIFRPGIGILPATLRTKSRMSDPLITWGFVVRPPEVRGWRGRFHAH